MNRPKTLLILGGSNCQINAFTFARERCLRTILFDYYANPPAARLADVHYQISTFDVEGCAALASRLELDGVMTLGTDQPVYTAALIAQRLGLPSFLDVDTALAVTNKQVMKQVFARHGIPSARWQVVDKPGLARLGWQGPVVIKPLDSQGQKGVFLAPDLAQAKEWFDDSVAFSRLDTLLCEEYYPSTEVTVSAWVVAGRATILAVTDRVTAIQGRSIGVCLAHRYPSLYAKGWEPSIDQLTAEVASAFGIQNGPLYIQMLIGSRGVLVNEVACRIGGAFEDVFIPKLTGFDILAATVDGALGGSPLTKIALTQTDLLHVRVLMIFCRNTVLLRLPGLAELTAIPFCYQVGFNYDVGDEIPAFENSGARVGYAVFVAPSAEKLAGSLERFWTLMGCAFYSDMD